MGRSPPAAGHPPVSAPDGVTVASDGPVGLMVIGKPPNNHVSAAASRGGSHVADSVPAAERVAARCRIPQAGAAGLADDWQ